MKFLIITVFLLLSGCSIIESPVYSVSGYNHTAETATVSSIMTDNIRQFAYMRGNRGKGLELAVGRKITKDTSIIMKRSVGFSEPLPVGTQQPEPLIIKAHNGLPNQEIPQDNVWFVANEYHHRLTLPPLPSLYGSDKIVMMFHVYTCHVEIDLDPSYYDKSQIPKKELSNNWWHKDSNGLMKNRKPKYHPECPPFDGGIYEIDLNGGYKKIGDRHVYSIDDYGTRTTVTKVEDLPPGAVELPDQ